MVTVAPTAWRRASPIQTGPLARESRGRHDEVLIVAETAPARVVLKRTRGDRGQARQGRPPRCSRIVATVVTSAARFGIERFRRASLLGSQSSGFRNSGEAGDRCNFEDAGKWAVGEQ